MQTSHPSSSEAAPHPGVRPACLITGAGARIGREIAKAMSEAGWDIAIHYRQSAGPAQALAGELSQPGRQAKCFQSDLESEAAVCDLFERAHRAFPALSCVVNNASEFEFDRPEHVRAESLSRHFQANLVTPVILTRCLHDALAPMHQKGADPIGVVIHLLDQKLANPNPDFFSYTLSKAALLEATRLCASALAPVLRVVAVAPGITLPSADQTEAEFQQAHQMTPLGASSRPKEIADAVVWLSRARAVTGTMLLVDGGQHLAAHPRDVMMMIRS
ncbi:MAG: SDR family oxidoreductase [Burkholderiaceae bacterium]|nr:SDR family oxidoreductase [Burkholderiaceae bacterium]